MGANKRRAEGGREAREDLHGRVQPAPEEPGGGGEKATVLRNKMMGGALGDWW